MIQVMAISNRNGLIVCQPQYPGMMMRRMKDLQNKYWRYKYCLTCY